MFKLWWLYRDRNYWWSRSETLETKLELERTANRRFERELISRIVTMTGQMGIAPEPSKPKQAIRPTSPPQPTESVMNTLTPLQVEDWGMYLEDARNNGVSKGQAWNDFYQREILSHFQISEELVDVEN
jgi:hypothetical protein